MPSIQNALNTPWKIRNEIERMIIFPWVRLVFAFNGIAWGRGWRIHGMPVIQKHRKSTMRFGNGLGLRSTARSNPLGPNRPVILCTWQAGAVLEVGDHFGMTGGSICAAEKIIIGQHVKIGANTTVMDTDFHPLDPEIRRIHPQDAATAPIVIKDDVFIGMNCLILKGVCLGNGCVIGAGSVVTKDVPAGAVAAGNPAKIFQGVMSPRIDAD